MAEARRIVGISTAADALTCRDSSACAQQRSRFFVLPALPSRTVPCKEEKPWYMRVVCWCVTRLMVVSATTNNSLTKRVSAGQHIAPNELWPSLALSRSELVGRLTMAFCIPNSKERGYECEFPQIELESSCNVVIFPSSHDHWSFRLIRETGHRRQDTWTRSWPYLNPLHCCAFLGKARLDHAFAGNNPGLELAPMTQHSALCKAFSHPSFFKKFSSICAQFALVLISVVSDAWKAGS